MRSSAADVLVVRSTQVTEPMLDAGHLPSSCARAPGSTPSTWPRLARGIYVSNCPGKNAVAVAELALGLMLALDRRIPDNVADLRAGHWNKKEYSKARGLHGRTLGLLGFGSIGQEVARRAKAFGLAVQVWSRSASPVTPPSVLLRFVPASRRSERGGRRVRRSPHRGADIISVHLALGKETRGFVNAAVLAHIRPGSFFINTARGEVVDYRRARQDAVRRRACALGLDVFPRSQRAATGDFTDPLMGCPWSTARITSVPPPTRRRKPSRRDRAHRPHVQGDRAACPTWSTWRARPRHPHAGGAAPRPARRAGPRLRPAAGGAPERAGDREHHLRRRARGRGAHQPGRCPAWRRPVRPSARVTTTSSTCSWWRS
jgi:phosphoglycerate dehydrogenase-like enzyme